MKPLSLNLSKMRKVAGDQHSSTFLHPSGHHVVIAHGGVSALQRKQLENMPVQKYAEGGDTLGTAIGYPGSPKPKPPKMMADGGDTLPPELADLPQDANAAPPAEPGLAETIGSDVRQSIGDTADVAKTVGGAILRPVGNFAKGLLGIPDAAANIPASAEQAANPGPSDAGAQPSQGAPQADKSAPPASDALPGASGNFATAFQQGQHAIDEQQQINAAKAKADADIQSQDLLNRQSLNQSIQDHTKDFMDHQKDLMKDYADNHINPNHYVENMGAVQKATTAIGLLLGGLGAGASGKNPAMEFLNKQIDRDIEAQRGRLDQQKTLLGANQAMFHDQNIADNQTRVNMNDIYDHQIQLAASKLGTPQAKAAADAAHAKFTMDNAALLQQNAIRAAVMGHMQQGGRGLRATDLAAAGMIPQEEAIKEQTSIDSQNKALASAAEIFNKYKQEQTAGNLLNPQSYARADALNAQTTNLVMESDASKRLTPESAKLEVKPFWVKTTDDPKTVDEKLRGIGNLVRQHAAPTPYMSHFAPQSLPQYDQTASSGSSTEGKTAINPKTGQRIVMKNGRWVPLGG
jgi:hypothetical protein